MNKTTKISIGILAIGIVLICGWLILSNLPREVPQEERPLQLIDCSSLEQEIKQEIEKANYCDKDEDCRGLATGICGESCGVYFNKNTDTEEIEKLSKEYIGKCQQEGGAIKECHCAMVPPVCINNKCVGERWKTYQNKFFSDYEIGYPDYMEVSELGENNRRATISTQDYKINMANGEITSGFKVDIFVKHFDSLDDLFYCNKEELEIEKDCLLADVNAQLVDYQKGEIKTESITIDGYSGVKYEFISSVGKNNNIGLVVKKDDKFYVVLIAYKTHRNTELFNKILSTFKFVIK